MALNKLVLGFLIVNIVIMGGIYFSYDNSIPHIQTHTMLVRESEKPVELYQITNRGVKKIWTSEFSGIDHMIAEVDDLDGDGHLEAVIMNKDSALYALDLETGTELWHVGLQSMSASDSELFLVDLDFDGYKEIIAKRNTPNPQFATETVLVYSHSGELLQKLPVYPTYNLKGPSNVRLSDLDSDGNSELIVSYGHVMWDYNNSVGAYCLEKYTWNPTTSTFDFVERTTGSDYGGNTDLEIIDTPVGKYIATIGWYNNPLRVFDSDLNLMWSKKTYNSSEFIQLADGRLTSFTDDTGKSHLIVAQNNYWTNHTLSILDYNPRTGEIQHKLKLTNYKGASITRLEDRLYMSSLELVQPDNEDRINIIRIISLPELILLDTITNPTDNRYILARANFDSTFNLVETHPYSSVLVRRGNSLEMINPERSYKLLDLESQFLDMVKVIPTPNLTLNGEEVTSFEKFDLIQIFVYLFIVDSILALSFQQKGWFFEVLDNFRLSDDWKLKTYLRMKPIFEHSYQHIPILSNNDFTLYPLALPSIDFSDLNIPEPESKSTTELDIDLKDWYENNAKRLKNLKATDFVILVSYLENDEPMTPVEVLEHVEVTAKSTIYRRINFLSKLGLLDATDDIEDQRSTKYQLTNLGISFLKSFHHVLSSIMG